MTKPLQNYIRMYRKRTGLTQVDVGILLGSESAASEMSKHERGSRLPSLRTALAYEIILQVPVARFFEGLYEEIEREVASRVAGLRDHVAKETPRAVADQKVRHLSAILESIRRHHGRVPSSARS